MGALFLFVLVFLVRHGLEISVGRGLDGLDHTAKAGIAVSELSLRSLRSPRGTELGTELYARTRDSGKENQLSAQLGRRNQRLPASQASVRRDLSGRKGLSH